MQEVHTLPEGPVSYPRINAISAPAGTRTVVPSLASSAMRPPNSKNCVERRIEYGRPDALMRFSCATFARRYALFW